MSELAKALVEVQANLPKIRKGETAKVPTKDGGSYSYTYADLADVTDEVFPLLTKNGLAFSAMPTVRDDGKFVLAYSLLHVSGEREDGSYLLPTSGTPQQVGSAITYARRYCLCAAVGVAPEDDDGQAAEQAARQPAEHPVTTIRERVKAAGIVDAFAAYLADVHHVNRLDELDDEQLRKVLAATGSEDGLNVIRDYAPAEVDA